MFWIVRIPSALRWWAASSRQVAVYVRERLRLLRLPDQAQQALAAGELPLSAGPLLERIAKVSAQVSEACVALVHAGHADHTCSNRSPPGSCP
jgi:hypothetical protein